MPVSDHTVDRRVRRSRSALLRAAVTLVTAQGTTDLTVSDIAEAADVSRQLVYQHFGDRDALLLQAAVDLADRELLPRIKAPREDGASRTLAVAQHFADHRPFYRAMLSGSCAVELTKAFTRLLSPFNEQLVVRMSARPLTESTVDDLTTFVTGGWSALLYSWLIEGADPLDPQGFTDRLMRMLPAIIDSAFEPQQSTVGVTTNAGHAIRADGA